MKILGAAASKQYSFERCVEIGKAVNEQLVSIGSALDHCNVPGRQNHDEIGDDVCVIGAGIHNEPVRILISGFKNGGLIKSREHKRFPLFRQLMASSHSYWA
jgi:triose/dihydroxyacetone kinase / FAD-AMP lyase (cyclizing)